MQALKNAIHIVLVLCMLATGLPLYLPGDANHDGEVGLADAILRVRDFAKTADNQVAFRRGMEDVLLAISVVAGFQKVIKSDRGTGSRENVNTVPIAVIQVNQNGEVIPLKSIIFSEQEYIYKSPDLTPLTPPPLPSLV